MDLIATEHWEQLREVFSDVNRTARLRVDEHSAFVGVHHREYVFLLSGEHMNGREANTTYSVKSTFLERLYGAFTYELAIHHGYEGEGTIEGLLSNLRVHFMQRLQVGIP